MVTLPAQETFDTKGQTKDQQFDFNLKLNLTGSAQLLIQPGWFRFGDVFPVDVIAFGAYRLCQGILAGGVGFCRFAGLLRKLCAGWRRGLGLAAMLVGLYGLLFCILQSEDMTLLMGSFTLFGLLACVMCFTRNMDWATLGSATGSGVDK